jgi:hypothetical protein
MIFEYAGTPSEFHSSPDVYSSSFTVKDSKCGDGKQIIYFADLFFSTLNVKEE